MAEIATPVTPKSPIFPDTLTSVTALARFEFEPGRGNEGTKVMMVEWQDDDRSRVKTGKWHVSWSADDEPSDNIHRVYFLLPPNATVPPHVMLAYQPPAELSRPEPAPLRMTVNPLPAIFTLELGATAKAAGKKGVLHTVWAKKRLQVLEKEIKQEQERNLEGVALEMVLSERQWIESNFGVACNPPALDLASVPKSPSTFASPDIQSPRSPGGGRLSEKLKGLSLGTSEKDLAGRGLNTPTREEHPLSPEASDMAYSSFGAFKTGTAPVQVKKVVAQNPPEHIRKQQEQNSAASMDFPTRRSSDPNGNDLFAVALNPRSPDEPKSPFSISGAEAGGLAKIKGER
ncbi:hypothetical protein LTR10_023192 [Elasticomyces elasticus]|uniref:Uncharacterized protein n=1 Tax=Exophiala sideris TaxID=1016849 RepID=A0ABR0J2E9_9EURO|nr:hypothetical protein LTR10_023192 [Elasticomyces elasticus]KAK5024177.1 hypothetical protein LTS07_008912 [Exophiala sideris]KAK5028963.1 hypothetical protein LTR13_008832 [Exophiala sideris]KAK5054889.1 hypothetical protein LTR69_008797 [Exophiala sideris]KAK5178786.1 hypothetical protein LTR44_008613 [Eurotiomycetes sp. CCFEE 6388]